MSPQMARLGPVAARFRASSALWSPDRDHRQRHTEARLLLPVAARQRLFELGLGPAALVFTAARTARPDSPQCGSRARRLPGPPICFPRSHRRLFDDHADEQW